MFKTKRKRAVALALIAFFCTAAATYVAVDWKRFGGGFLAFLRGKGEPHFASTGSGRPSGSAGDHLADVGGSHSASPTLPQLLAATSHRRHTAGATGGASGHKSDDDLFAYGNPAAGGIPPASFIVAQNDAPAGGTDPAPGPSAAPDSGGTGGVSSPAPAPTTGNGGTGDSGLPIIKTPAAAPSPAAPTPSPAAPTPSPPAPAPAPNQSGTSDSGPPTTPTPPPISPVPPVSAVPEASSLAMMSLGALFLAVAAQRRRKNG